MLEIAMFTDIKAKKSSNNARKKLDCLKGLFNNNKTLSIMACKPKISIIVVAMGLGDVNLFCQYLFSE